MATHVGERGDRFGEARLYRFLGAATLLLILGSFADVDHAFKAEQSVKRWRRRLDPARQLAGRRHQGFDHSRVDLHRGYDAVTLDREACLD